MDWQSIFISFKLATITTLLLLVICLPLAWWFSRSRSFYKIALEAIFSLPLVLPPTVLGFYLLVFMNPTSVLGKFWTLLSNGNLVFSFSGLVIGSVFYSLPFVLRPIQNAFESIDLKLVEMASTLGYTAKDIFWNIYLPLSKPAMLTAAVLGFAHTLSEFGVVLMLGGNIPGKTRTVSIAIYDAVESSNYEQAHQLALFMLILSFFILYLTYVFNRKWNYPI
jgi:molybdate transport system permease protein